MASIIKHLAEVKEVRAKSVIVSMTQMSACSGCHAKDLCTASDSKEREMEIKGSYPEVQIGDTVMIEGSQSIGWWAILYSFVLPIILLIVVLTTASGFGLSELYMALLAFGTIAIYFLILKALDKKIAKKFDFSIRKIYTKDEI